ncbi:hypothetical protein A2U01_0115269, partial [Trifolium medium]|nr:hypothetical protein [Trifolium medium]
KRLANPLEAGNIRGSEGVTDKLEQGRSNHPLVQSDA